MLGPYLPSHSGSHQPAKRGLEDCLLELILIDTVALGDPSRDLAAEQMIERCVPASCYDHVMDLYDELSAEGGAQAGAEDQDTLLQPWYDKACAKDSLWKIQMIAKLLYVAAGGQVVSTEALAEVAALAERIDATPELRALLLVEADQDPVPGLRRARRLASVRPQGVPYGPANMLDNVQRTNG